MLRTIPVVISLLVLAAHFLRSGSMLVVAVILMSALLLTVRRSWVPVTVQVILALGAFEWVKTLVVLFLDRANRGEPYVRMTIILLAVATVTALSAVLMRAGAVRSWYRDVAETEDETPE